MHAPRVVWVRIKEATEQHHDIPPSFWSTIRYRVDIAKIACYESTFYYHAQNSGHEGWFQMSRWLIWSEGVRFRNYWLGTRREPAGWFQCTAGERYIHQRYGNPAVAWAHEEDYGWY